MVMLQLGRHGDEQLGTHGDEQLGRHGDVTATARKAW